MRLNERVAAGLVAFAATLWAGESPAAERAPPSARESGARARFEADRYFRAVAGIVSLHVQPPKGRVYLITGSGVTAVRFVVDRDGKLLSSAVAKSSGSTSFDDEALAVVRRAAKWFPPMPASFPGDHKAFQIPIRFSAR